MNPLDTILSWHDQLKENNKIIVHFLQKNPESFPITAKIGKSFAAKEDEAITSLSDLKNELDDLIIVSLFVTFEQFIIDYITNTNINTVNQETDLFKKEIFQYCLKDSDKWKFKEILDLFKPIIDPTIIGDIKQIYDYRNWVAHGKRKQKPINTDPITVHNKLTDFLKRAMIHI